jgi:hypothetical protein
MTDDDKLGLWEKLLYVAIIIAIIGGMFIVTTLYKRPVTTPVEKPSTYNGFGFELVDGMWTTEWLGQNAKYELSFRYHPVDVQNVSVPYQKKSTFNEKLGNPAHVFLTSMTGINDTGYVQFAGLEVARRMVTFLHANVSVACTDVQSTLCPTINDTINCGTAKDINKSIIFFDIQEKPEVVIDGNCVIIRGKGEDMIRAAERFLYTNIFRIITK